MSLLLEGSESYKDWNISTSKISLHDSTFCQKIGGCDNVGLLLLFIIFNKCLFLHQLHAGFVTMALQHNLISSVVIPPALFFLPRIVLATQDYLWFHTNIGVVFSRSVNNSE